MKADIMSFRRYKRHTYKKEMILFCDSLDSREKAQKMIGKEVEFRTETDKIIKGVVTKAHGNNGKLLVRFEKGMPGQALGETVKIL